MYIGFLIIGLVFFIIFLGYLRLPLLSKLKIFFKNRKGFINYLQEVQIKNIVKRRIFFATLIVGSIDHRIFLDVCPLLTQASFEVHSRFRTAQITRIINFTSPIEVTPQMAQDMRLNHQVLDGSRKINTSLYLDA